MRGFLLLTMIVLCMNFHAQNNLVPNGGFEIMSSCPGLGVSFEQSVEDWTSGYEQDTPDYFNQCSSIPAQSVPDNWRGWQLPFQGESYVGIWTFSLLHADYREYIQTELKEPLHRRIRYKISFRTSFADNSGYAISTLGVALTIDKPDTVSGGSRLNAEPQILNDPLYPITDSVNWVLITDTFRSDTGGEQFITIGNFNTDSESDTLLFNQNASSWWYSYYFIDDVSVVALDSVPNAMWETEEPAFELWPNPARHVLRFSLRGSTWRAGGLGVRVMDAVGREVQTPPGIPCGEVNGNIDVSGLPKGIYLLELTDAEGKRSVRRFVKQ